MRSHDNDKKPRGDTDGADATLTPRTGEGAQSALEALRRQQAHKPATVIPAPLRTRRRGGPAEAIPATPATPAAPATPSAPASSSTPPAPPDEPQPGT